LRSPSTRTPTIGSDLTPDPYNSMAEAVAGYLGAVGILSRVRTMERATFVSTWGEKKLRGVVLGAQGAGGSAATRIERVAFAPIWENGFIRGVGPRVEEPGLTLIPSSPYSARYEDVRLKREESSRVPRLHHP